MFSLFTLLVVLATRPASSFYMTHTHTQRQKGIRICHFCGHDPPADVRQETSATSYFGPAQRATVAHLEPGQSAEKSSRQEHQPGVGIKLSHLDPTVLNPAKRVVDTFYLPQHTHTQTHTHTHTHTQTHTHIHCKEQRSTHILLVGYQSVAQCPMVWNEKSQQRDYCPKSPEVAELVF